jgi:hypothetical protein
MPRFSCLSGMRRVFSIRIPPEAVAAAIAAFSFILAFRFIAGSDFRELALNRFQDDSYYYLQPAWQLASKVFFTFDGIHPTYGFQPLWMLVLSVQALFTPDKISFVRMAALLGAGFYCLAGAALFYLVRVWMPGWRAVIAPALWLLNPPLLTMYMTGKENALYAFLLIAAAALIAGTADRVWTRRSAAVAGILLGLMALTRVNALIPGILLLVVLLFGEGGKEEKAARLGWMLIGACAILIPWMMYAQSAFGTVFPNSGAAKLIGGWAGAAVAAHGWFPWIPSAWFDALLPATEKIFFAHPEAITVPSLGLAAPFFLDAIPDMAIGFWKDELLGHVIPYRAKYFLWLVAALVVLGWILTQHPGVRRKIKWLSGTPASTTGAAVLAVLLLAAAINGFSNWLLLPDYLNWGMWYAVPETLAVVLMAATALGVFISIVERLSSAKWRLGRRWIGAVIGLLAVGAGAFRSAEDWTPVAFDPARGITQAEVYQGLLWMNDNLPPGARVGSFSAGLMGYFAGGYTVINLDGLANTPGFVADLLPQHILYARSLAPDTPLREYLREEHITYLANYDPLDRIQSGQFMGLASPANSRLLYEGSQDILWGPGEPTRRFGVVEITP